MRTGTDPSGHQLSSQMPWRAIGKMDDEELTALYEYLTHLRGFLSKGEDFPHRSGANGSTALYRAPFNKNIAWSSLKLRQAWRIDIRWRSGRSRHVWQGRDAHHRWFARFWFELYAPGEAASERGR
jgi:hypothetical protein